MPERESMVRKLARRRHRCKDESRTTSHSFTFDPWKKFPEYRAMKLPKAARQIALVVATILPIASGLAEVNKVEKIAPDVYFHEGDIKGRGHCNNGWIVFEDYVLV